MRLQRAAPARRGAAAAPPLLRQRRPPGRVAPAATQGSQQQQPPPPAREPVYLSDLIAFESDIADGSANAAAAPAAAAAPEGEAGAGAADSAERVQEIIDRATKVLAAARQALGPDAAGDASTKQAQAAAPAAGMPAQQADAAARTGASVVARVGAAGGPPPSEGAGSGSGSGSGEGLARRWGPLAEGHDLTRHVLQAALDEMAAAGGAGGGAAASPADEPYGGGGGGSSSSSSSFAGDLGGSGGGSAPATGEGAAPPSWAASFLSLPSAEAPAAGGFGAGPPSDGFAGGGAPQLQPALQLQTPPAMLAFADPEPPPAPTAALLFASQAEQDAARARSAVLPPLQSIAELTSAFRPPERGAAPEASAGPASAGRALADGSGALPDGSTWEKRSGVEYGENGYWKRWHLLRGTAAGGRVKWEETWWEASDWTGYRELGAEKSGRDAAGGAWREAWTERMRYAGAGGDGLDCVVEREAHKWAHAAAGDEWEERWSEHYAASGRVDKTADKWGKSGPNVWHERWGEEYDGRGACTKWTDKWAERLLPGGAREQWGDKWHEAFAHGAGEKNGEVWSVDAGGHRYQRWWGEHHPGGGAVRRFGHSTAGEQWDETVHMDTYYNPVPHFGYALALAHSPQLRNVPLRPKDVDAEDPFGPGIDAL